MPYKSLSEHIKSQNDKKLKEEKISQAVDTYRVEQAKSESQKGAHTIAKEYGVEKAYKTIINRYNNGWSIRKAHEEQQKLTASEEAVLVDFLMQSADHGFPQS